MPCFYSTRVRLLDDDGETRRDWLHEDFRQEYPYKSFEVAEANLEEAVKDLFCYGDEVAEITKFEITQKYPKEQGGGFWFKISAKMEDDDEPTDFEGRALVLTAFCGE